MLGQSPPGNSSAVIFSIVTCDYMNGVEWRGTHQVYSKYEDTANHYSDEEVGGQCNFPILLRPKVKTNWEIQKRTKA